MVAYYTDVLRQVYGGSTDDDYQAVPYLVAKDRGMQVAHDIDGTSDNLGSSVGKSTGVHRLNMASKCFPEHGYLMIIALVRFPNIGSDMTPPTVKYNPNDDTVFPEVRSDPRVDLVHKDREWNLTDWNSKSSTSSTNKHYAALGS